MKSSEEMEEIGEGSVHLVITSPPYNVGMEYEDILDFQSYKKILEKVFCECFRVMTAGGRICVNVAPVKKPSFMQMNYLVADILKSSGFMQKEEIIWNKGRSAGKSTAWGSFMSAKSPNIRGVHEYILVFQKPGVRAEGISDIPKKEFLEFTKSVWNINAVPVKNGGHPAAFPIELAERLIKLYSYVGDVVLDPFAGSGTTLLAAKQLGRDYIGYELNKKYIKMIERRLE